MLIVISAVMLFAQSPQAFKYQAVVRNSLGELINNQEIGIRISILEGSEIGPAVFSESHSPSTNQFGLVNLEVGTGTLLSGNFSNIHWSDNDYFLKVELDELGGNTYVVMGTSQIVSVPMALHSQNSSISDKLSDKDWDTYITPEMNSDDDTIRMFIAGFEKLKITERSIEQTNIGNSVFIGKNAGKNDYLLGYENVFIGHNPVIVIQQLGLIRYKIIQQVNLIPQ